MQLIALRHGETEWNVAGRIMGHLDSPLTPRGTAQAAAIAQRLKQLSIAALYSSDLGRARYTAETIAVACGVCAELNSGLRERDMGIFQGLTWSEIQSQHPREAADYKTGGATYVIPGGESARQRFERSVQVLTAIAQAHCEDTVAIVTHGGFLMGFLEFVLGMQPGGGRRFKRNNCAFNGFQYVDGRWCLLTWNDTSHLAGL